MSSQTGPQEANSSSVGGFIFGEVPKLLWVSIDGNVFAIHEDQLRRTSPFFDTMLQLPSGGQPQEGSSSKHPLPLDSHATREQWAAYWKYIYRPHYSQQPEAPTQESWIDLLAVAVKFEVNAAVHDAKEALRMGGPFELPATQMLNLGRLYLFDDWISDATLKITSTPMPSVPTREYRLLGDETLALLIELQFKLLQHRANLVAAFPGQLKNHAFSCRQEKSCRSAWLKLQLLSVVKSRANEAALMTDMSMDCARVVTEQCQSALTGRDDQLVARIVSQIKAVHLGSDKSA